MISEILVPFNGSDDTIRAVEIASGLARASSRPIRILAYSNDVEAPVHSRALFEIADSIGTRYGLSAQITTVTSRFLADELVLEATRRPGSVLCVPSQGLGRKALIAGSLSTELLTYTAGPIVLVGPDCEEKMFDHDGPLVVAIDGTEQSEQIVPIAHEWANEFDLSIEVFTVIEGPPTPELATALATGDVQETTYVSRVAHDPELKGDDVSYEVLHGKPVKEILREAGVKNASMIAIASHVPLGIDRLLHGSVLDEVVRHSPVPVLAINQWPATRGLDV